MRNHAGFAGRPKAAFGLFALAGSICLLGLVGLASRQATAEKAEAPPPPVRNETPAAAKNPETLIQNWPERSRLAARALLEKYGRPDIFDENRLAWEGNRPWDETVVRRAAPADVPALTSRDVLEQSISYRVPPGKAAALKSFDGRLVVDRENAVLTSYSASEGLNYLALNLADEIVEGKRSPEEARAFYRRTAELAEAGKSSPYMNGFLFPLSARAAPLE